MSAIREVYPYLIVGNAEAAIEFYHKVFDAEEMLRVPDAERGRIGHAELRLGPTTIMLADEYPELGIRSPAAFGGTGTSLHLHVDDVDALARRAVRAGATMLREPTDYDHGERQCRVRDPFGHEWLLGQQIGMGAPPKPGPNAEPGSGGSGPNVFPGLRYRDEHAAMAWLERAFGFARHALFTDDDGDVVHAEMRLGPGIVMIGAAPECEEGFNIYVHVADVDQHHARAVRAGAEITRPLADTGYGSREYGARDLDGHYWYFGTYLPAPAGS
ncbi:MAG: VOC family protein [Gemmatimonadales bacterium]